MKCSILIGCLLLASLVACANPAPSSPSTRPLTNDELARLSADGRVSQHLPIRFSAEIENGNEAVTVTAIRLRVHGREIDRLKRIPPGDSARLSVQFIYPEDPDWGRIEPEKVEWQLVGAEGIDS